MYRVVSGQALNRRRAFDGQYGMGRDAARARRHPALGARRSRGAFPLLMLTATRWIGRAHRFFDFMVPYNWCQVPQSALFVLAGLVSAGGILSSQASEAIDIIAALATLVYEWFIARVALDTTGL